MYARECGKDLGVMTLDRPDLKFTGLAHNLQPNTENADGRIKVGPNLVQGCEFYCRCATKIVQGWP